jgi:hypothetical protein
MTSQAASAVTVRPRTWWWLLLICAGPLWTVMVMPALTDDYNLVAAAASVLLFFAVAVSGGKILDDLPAVSLSPPRVRAMWLLLWALGWRFLAALVAGVLACFPVHSSRPLAPVFLLTWGVAAAVLLVQRRPVVRSRAVAAVVSAVTAVGAGLLGALVGGDGWLALGGAVAGATLALFPLAAMESALTT